MASNIIKHNFGRKSVYGGTSRLDFISIGEVKSVDDDTQSGRIIVDIKGVDDNIEESDKALAFPLLPKHLQVMPKVGESVFVLKLDLKDKNFVNRYWIGPIISQPQKLNLDPHFFTSQAALPSGTVNLEQAPKYISEANGVFPDKSYISIQGRNNSDLIFKDNELLLRAGQHELNQPLKFNNKNMGFFQIKYNANISVEDGDNTVDTKMTVANVVADKIHLITHNATKNFALKDRNNLITDSAMSDIINNAHPIPYGDILLKFIEATKAYILNHVHSYHGNKPVAEKAVSDNFINFDLSRINSKNIKID